MVPVRSTLFVAASLAFVLFCSFATPGQKRTPRVAKPAPAIVTPKVTPVDTEQFKALLKRDAGRPLLVNFWATWCAPCREEFPDLVKIDAEYRPKGLDFIAVTLDDMNDINKAVPKFLREMKAMMPAYLLNVRDPEPAILYVDKIWSGALPATFLYNSKGEVVYKMLGPVKPLELRAEIEKLVGAKEEQ